MDNLIRVASVSCALLLIPFGPARGAEGVQAALQGKWIVESFQYNGGPGEMMKEAVREFKDNKYTLTPKAGDVIEGTIKLDPSQEPKTIDLEINGRTLKGIYEVDGDMLKMSYTLNDGERPTDFASKPDSGQILVTHKRAK